MCESREYLVSAAWITSGILTIIQVFRAKILGTGYYLGTGLISVMGTSFTFLPIAREMVIRSITDARAEGKCECTPGTADDGSATCGFPFDCKGYGKEGYGKFLGTAMVAAFVEVVIALMPSKMRQKLFPPVVTGVSVMLIGASLITAGIKYVGGGVFCAENDLGRSAAFGGPQLCNENGNVILPFGDGRAGAHVHEQQRRVLLCAEAKISRRAPPDSPVDFHTGAAPSTTRARTRTGRRRSSS